MMKTWDWKPIKTWTNHRHGFYLEHKMSYRNMHGKILSCGRYYDTSFVFQFTFSGLHEHSQEAHFLLDWLLDLFDITSISWCYGLYYYTIQKNALFDIRVLGFLSVGSHWLDSRTKRESLKIYFWGWRWDFHTFFIPPIPNKKFSFLDARC